ncbi:hypothetical protein F5Y17DRAFT_414430 [Xylariaceae sp. FL0594]|nr:hypothetical protein F5Y17DRAFT_414430 [Xylariaceae sp. FL0594]
MLVHNVYLCFVTFFPSFSFSFVFSPLSPLYSSLSRRAITQLEGRKIDQFHTHNQRLPKACWAIALCVLLLPLLL